MRNLEASLGNLHCQSCASGRIVSPIQKETSRLASFAIFHCLKAFAIQDTGGTRKTVDQGIGMIKEMLLDANRVKREFPGMTAELAAGKSGDDSDKSKDAFKTREDNQKPEDTIDVDEIRKRLLDSTTEDLSDWEELFDD